MRIFRRGAHILSILGYMSGEYLNGVELSLISHWHEYVRRAMKGMKTLVTPDNTNDPSDQRTLENRRLMLSRRVKELRKVLNQNIPYQFLLYTNYK